MLRNRPRARCEDSEFGVVGEAKRESGMRGVVVDKSAALQSSAGGFGHC